jgi:hypothetical protein
MAIRAQKCPKCGKALEIVKESPVPALKITILKLKCGHDLTEELIVPTFKDDEECTCGHSGRSHNKLNAQCKDCTICKAFSAKQPRDPVWLKAYDFSEREWTF